MPANIETIHLFVPEEFVDLKQRGFLIPILRPLFKKDSYTDAQRIADYGLSEKDFTRVWDMENADVVVLPMAWEYYKKKGLEDKIVHWLGSMSQLIPVWTWNAGDYGVNIPELPENVSVFCLNAYASKKKRNVRAMPAFFSDPVNEIPEWDLRNKSSDITVGFCGQAKGNWLKYTLDPIRTFIRNSLYYLGVSPYLPHAIFSSTRLRNETLDVFEKDPAIHTEFIKRRKYRAGATTPEERERSRTEFLDNMAHTNYTICIRGGGNFSVRLFETMAMGRIPVQVDTDCMYPLPELIDWKEQTCFIPYEKRNQVQLILKKYHQTHNVEEVKKQNREIWSELLTMKGFFKAEFKLYKVRNV